jgi:hypothetical protein
MASLLPALNGCPAASPRKIGAYFTGDLACQQLAAFSNPKTQRSAQETNEPVIRGAVFVCEFTGHSGNEQTDRYWHGTHEGSSRFAGDGETARASGVLTLNPDPRPDPSK